MSLFGTYINLDSNIVTSTLNNAGTLFTDLWPLLQIIVIVSLAIIIIVALIKALHR